MSARAARGRVQCSGSNEMGWGCWGAPGGEQQTLACGRGSCVGGRQELPVPPALQTLTSCSYTLKGSEWHSPGGMNSSLNWLYCWRKHHRTTGCHIHIVAHNTHGKVATELGGMQRKEVWKLESIPSTGCFPSFDGPNLKSWYLCRHEPPMN